MILRRTQSAFCAACLLIAFAARGQEPTEKLLSEAIEKITSDLMAAWRAEIEDLADPELIKAFSTQTFDDETVRSLYRQYRKALVTPPAPDAENYGIEDGEQALKRTHALAREFHNMTLAMPTEAYEKYGMLIAGMREVLFLDYKHIPYAMRGDRARDVFWHELHTDWAEGVDAIYAEHFGNTNGGE